MNMRLNFQGETAEFTYRWERSKLQELEVEVIRECRGEHGAMKSDMGQDMEEVGETEAGQGGGQNVAATRSHSATCDAITSCGT